MTLERRLALAALTLGLGAALVSSPFRSGSDSIVTGAAMREVAREALEGRDRITPFELARWILERDADLDVVDLRSQEAFADFTLPQARRVEVDSLVATGPDPSAHLVLVSADGILAAQAWVMVRLTGHRNAWILQDGVLGWIQEVLIPIVPAELTDQDRAYWEERIEVSRYYGGEPRRVADPGEAPPPRDVRDPDALVDQLVQEGRDRGCGW